MRIGSSTSMYVSVILCVYCMVGNFRGVQIFVDFVDSLIHLNFSYVYNYMVRVGVPQKYKPTKLSYIYDFKLPRAS